LGTVDHRVALITGCGRAIGIGGSIARVLAAAGTRVVVSDVAARGVQNDDWKGSTRSDWGGVQDLVDELTDAGGVASWTLGDVSDEADSKRMVEETLERYGRLDILVNNAAAPHGADVGDLEHVPVDAWDRVMAINARGPFLMSRAALEPMKAGGWGRIVNTSSVAGKFGAPQRAAYSASKAAVLGFTKSIALDVARFGITVNAVCPGSISTERVINATVNAGWSDVEAGMAERSKGIPARRYGTPEEIAACVAFLASDGAGYLTGQSIVIDGGGMS
jgi:3-oxoacyl-[acyl-carrier protein] reductase